MKATTLLLLAMTLSTGLAAAESAFSGTWKGTMNGLPAVTLVIKEDGGRISGTIQFFLQVRDDEKSSWRSAGSPEGVSPLVSPVQEGNTLKFEAWHHTCHECKEWGANVPMTVQLLAPDRLKLGDVVLTKEK